MYQSLFLIRQFFFFFSYALPLFTALGSSSNVSEWSRKPPVASGSPFVLAWPQSSFRHAVTEKSERTFWPTQSIRQWRFPCEMWLATCRWRWPLHDFWRDRFWTWDGLHLNLSDSYSAQKNGTRCIYFFKKLSLSLRVHVMSVGLCTGKCFLSGDLTDE